MACPNTGESEWVEIYNPDSILYILYNWQIKDALGNSRVFSTTISAQSYAVVTLSSGIINNEGDAVYLDRPDGQRLSSAQLPACHKGKSFVLQSGAWIETSTSTKGAANIIDTSALITDSSEMNDTSSDNQDDNILEESNTSAVSESIPPFSYAAPSSLPLPQLTDLNASSSASPSGVVLSMETKADDHEQDQSSAPFVENTLPFWYEKYFIFTLLGAGSLCVGWSGFQLFQWYTEQYAQNDLQVV
jgi:hypothetical protein